MQPADLDFDPPFPASPESADDISRSYSRRQYPGSRRQMAIDRYNRRRRQSAFQRLWSKISSTSSDYAEGEMFDNENMRAVSIMMAAVAIVVIGSLAIASASRDAIPKASVELTLSLLFAMSALWIFSALLLGWRGKLTDDSDYKHRKNNQMTFQKIGAIIFGAGGMLYNVLRISEYMYTKDEKCRKVESVIMSVFYITFVAVQLYFLLLFSKVSINKGKVTPIISRFGLMLVLGTNISVWIYTTISEARHVMEEDEHEHSKIGGSSYKNAKYCPSGITGLFSSYLYPCVIECSLISSCMIYLVWSRVRDHSEFDEVFRRNSITRSSSYARYRRSSFKKAASIARIEHKNKCLSVVLPQIKEESLSRLSHMYDSDVSDDDCHVGDDKDEDAQSASGHAEYGERDTRNNDAHGGGGGEDRALPNGHCAPLNDDVTFKIDPAELESEHTTTGNQMVLHSSTHGRYDNEHNEVRQVFSHPQFEQYGRECNEENHHQMAAPPRHTFHPPPLRSVDSQRSIATTVFEPDWEENKTVIHHASNYCGLFLGIMVILATFGTIIIFLYMKYSSKDGSMHQEMFIVKSIINCLCVCATLVTHFQMKGMIKKNAHHFHTRTVGGGRGGMKFMKDSKKHQHQLGLDKALLGVSLLGLLAYCTLTIIAGAGSPDKDAALTVVDSVIVILEAVIQSLFLMTSFLPRRATTREHRSQRPGREGLFFLLICNFCLWAFNSFGVRNEIANHVQIYFYSFQTWVILSHVTFPLLILFRFHSVVVISDVITHAYTAKYIGIEDSDS